MICLWSLFYTVSYFLHANVIDRFKTNVTGLLSRSREIMLSIRSTATIAVFNAPHTKLISAGIDRCLKTCGWNMTFDWMNTAVSVSSCQSSSAKQKHFIKNVDYFLPRENNCSFTSNTPCRMCKNCSDKNCPIHLLICLSTLTKSVQRERNLRFSHQTFFRLLFSHKKRFVREIKTCFMWKHLNEQILFKSKTLY